MRESGVWIEDTGGKENGEFFHCRTILLKMSFKGTHCHEGHRIEDSERMQLKGEVCVTGI